MSEKYLHRFSILLALATFVLVFSGGLVTSKGVGMAVPDWPTTYGYNMFLFPFSMWVGGIFHEHLHRLIASTVGLLTIGLCGWLWATDPRRWMKILGVVAVFAVILQGVLGGLRVNLMKDQIGIFHGCLAQSFLLLTAFIAVATSPWWKSSNLSQDPAGQFTRSALFLTVLIFVNMTVAATMRHAHAGLSIPDFPTAYGQIIPPLDPAAVEKINVERIAKNQPETSATLIALQFTHRIIAYFLAVAAPWFCYRIFKAGGVLKKWSVVLPILILVQIGLGAWTVWSNKAADIATAHVAVGAGIFILTGLFTAIGYRSRFDTRGVNLPNARQVEFHPKMAELSS